MITKRIGIIGCGNMGEALIRGLLRSRAISKKNVLASDSDPVKREAVRKRYRIATTDDNKKVALFSDAVVIAVKPKEVDSVLEGIRDLLSGNKTVISLAAGVTTSRIEARIGEGIPVVRVMPNLPAIVGKAVSSVSAGTSARRSHIKAAKDIFSSVGDVFELDEGLLDAVTALSGSGPAYFFYFIEALVEAAKELGVDERTAKLLAVKTALGSAQLLEDLKEEPRNLRARVTSKGGTTEAALGVFESKGLKDIVKEAVKRAAARSKELSAF